MFKFIGKTFTVIAATNVIGICLYIQYKQNSANKLNIVFDLDETIVHTDKINNITNYNKKNISSPDIKHLETPTSQRQVWVRPFVISLLPVIAKFNNLYLFTKATKPYADTILEQTNLSKYFKEKKYRDSCEKTCKDLEKLNLDVNLSVLIDDKLTNKCDKQNFYHIPRFNYYVRYDYEFIKVFGFILWLNIKKDLGIIK
jgi:TFIIF-interacting CTD phosphatase-like protein